MRILLRVKTAPTGVYCDHCSSEKTFVTLRWGLDEKAVLTCNCPLPFEVDFEAATGAHSKTLRQLNTRRAGKQAEQAARDTFSRKQPASGSLQHPSKKGDVRKRGRFRIECKFTRGASSFTLERSVLNKIRAECAYPERPAVDIMFTNKAGKQVDRWVAIPYEDWLENASTDDD